MKFKSALLATAAAVVSTSAFAADAVVEKAPVAANYVKICDTFGAGYFYIPGSDTCLQISGRVRAGATYVGSSKASASTLTATADGRVGFSVAQATDFGKSLGAIRFGADGGSSASVQLAYITIGDFSVGYSVNDAQYFDLGSNGDSSFNANGSYAGVLTNSGFGARYEHSFGGGFSAGLSVDYASNSPALLAAPGKDPDISAFATYESGKFSGTIAASYDTTKISSTAGGWGVAAKGSYGVSDALSVLGFVGYTDTTSSHVRYTNLGLGAKYTVSPKLALYADAFYSVRSNGYKNSVGVNAGAVYTIAKNLSVEAEEVYQTNASATTSSYTEWTTLVRLTRAF